MTDNEFRIAAAESIAFKYAGIDGAHHKQWVIDQMLRALLGEEYAEWVDAFEDGGKYPWDTGTLP